MRYSENPETSDHYFISPEDVKKFESNIAAYTEINGYQYFTTVEELDRCDIYVIDPKGVEDLKQRIGEQFDLIPIYLRVPKTVAKRRAAQRKDGLFDERTKREDEQFSQYEKDMPWYYHILNDGTFEEGVERLERIIKKELTKGEEIWSY